MPSFCAVVNCSDKYGHAESISFHKFPFKRKDLLQQWQDFTQRGTDWMPSKWSAICSRHFLDSDFNCINERKTLKKCAVPTVRVTQQSPASHALQPPPPASAAKSVHVQNVVVAQLKGPLPARWQQSEQQSLATTAYSNFSISASCRLCGTTSKECISFSDSFEVFGKIQKCFPTLQIQQQDALSQHMCSACGKNVNDFAHFIDRVLETQAKLAKEQRNASNIAAAATSTSNAALNNFSACGSMGTSTAIERQLKIKQEPFVRVKQEVADGFDSLFGDDLDMGIDDGCEHDAHEDEIEQKFQFCDFPMLNAQDIINNCDIMEIINLDDPFINITDDDAVAQNQTTTTNQHNIQTPATAVDADKLKSSQQQHQHQQQRGINASDLLQTELLNEEHNYANTGEESQEFWQLKHKYKKEKIDEIAHSEPEAQQKPQQQPLLKQQTVIQEVEVATTDDLNPSKRAIVTNVSKIANPMLHHDLLPTEHAQGPSIINAPPTQASTSNKPNIVVLNDSIVKSSEAFKLLTCNLCALKFFTNESLNQHYMLAHGNPAAAPMVCVPSSHIGMSLKVESNAPTVAVPQPSSVPVQQAAVSMQPAATAEPHQEYWHTGDWLGTGQQLSNAKSQINILDMQQSFLRQPPVFSGNGNKSYDETAEQNGYQPTFQNCAVNQKTEQHLAIVSENYSKLKRRYRLLQRKCLQLASGAKKLKHRCQRCRQRFGHIAQLLQHKRLARHYISKPSTFYTKCAGCQAYFRTHLALRQHMRYICQSLPLRNFRSKLQSFKCRHCQAITFTHWRLYRRHELKCRNKRRKKHSAKPTLITINNRRKSSVSGRANKERKSLACADCGKVFGSMNSLNQHRITHSTERRHKCGLCSRLFKRRHGLAQHIRGFHLQLKPYACPVCKHSYALKCDMLRCRHSQKRPV